MLVLTVELGGFSQIVLVVLCDGLCKYFEEIEGCRILGRRIGGGSGGGILLVADFFLEFTVLLSLSPWLKVVRSRGFGWAWQDTWGGHGGLEECV